MKGMSAEELISQWLDTGTSNSGRPLICNPDLRKIVVHLLGPCLRKYEAAARADERVKAWKARGEADAEKIRKDCTACYHGVVELDGGGDPIECEYCGTPIAAIKDMLLPEAPPVEPRNTSSGHDDVVQANMALHLELRCGGKAGGCKICECEILVERSEGEGT